jgi:hypothetical protein
MDSQSVNVDLGVAQLSGQDGDFFGILQNKRPRTIITGRSG